MKIKYLGINEIPNFHKPLSLALGYFDGIHLGHMELLHKTMDLAKQYNLASAMITFDPNPLITLGKIKQEQVLTTLEDKINILEELGLDYLIILKFNKEVANLTPEEFVNDFIKPMKVKEIVCGYDYYFGKNNQGNTNTLIELSNHQFNVHIIHKVMNEDEKISSSRIISLLKQGNIKKANELLGRRFTIKGTVIKGRQLGRTLGFPTANIDYGNYIIPKNGVYHVRFKIYQKTYTGMCNIGVNPTVGALDHISLEVHIFDFDEMIYNHFVEVEFVSFIRDETQFSSKQELIQQLKKDANIIKSMV